MPTSPRSRILSALVAAGLLLTPCLSVPAAGQEATPRAERRTDRIALEDYLDWEDVQDPQLSPDGRQVVFTRRWIDKLTDKWESSLWIVNADGSRARFLVNGSNPRWSPDGTRIAYTQTPPAAAGATPTGSPAAAPKTQIFTRWMDAEGAVTQLTRLDENPANLEWSPDGKWIAFTMLVPARSDWRIDMPAAPKGAKWTETPRVVDRLTYRADREGFIEEGNRHIFVVSADNGGTPRQLTSGAFNHGAPRWMPDGRTIVFSGLRVDDAEYRWRESDIYKIGLAGGEAVQLTTRKGPDTQPVPSPDGKWIAYTGYDSTSDTWVDAKLHLMSADGTAHRVLTPAWDRAPSNLTWAKDGSAIYFDAENEGSRNLYVASLAGEVKPVTSGRQVLSTSSINANGTAVGVMSTATHPNDVVLLNLKQPGSVKWLTAVNEDVLAGKALAQTEEIWYTSKDGTRVQGWIVRPPDYTPGRKYPLMLEIHGGPHSMYNTGFSFSRQDHAANGYVTLYTNPRGSTGYGSAFGNAIKNAYPGKDFDDLMAGVDTVIARGIADPKNLFVYGCSGGGVLTAWIVGHTNRFAAASSNCPVINWMSFVGTTDGAGWYYNFEKLPWEDPSEHLRRSPLMYVGNVTTPTMLMTGVNDLRTPMEQTEQFYRALKLRKVPNELQAEQLPAHAAVPAQLVQAIWGPGGQGGCARELGRGWMRWMNADERG
ncbi:MAG TPA: S9 family peptidase [Gemmatimonadaceae bacterium]|nr:S9 family peptidase [Gemmatimonadaceae bacterium]